MLPRLEARRRACRVPRVVILVAVAAVTTGAATRASAQVTGLSVLQAEDRRAPTLQDLATIRAGAHSLDPDTARIGVRALGRLERPALIADIVPSLRHSLPLVRAEAANAVAQAAQGVRSGAAAGTWLATGQSALAGRLEVEADQDVRAALCESIGRMPYASAADAAHAESLLVDFAPRALTNTDRLGLAKGLEALARISHEVRPLSTPAIDVLKVLARDQDARAEQDRLRDARVRRLALEALITLDAADAETVRTAAADPDPQVRRLAVRAAVTTDTEPIIVRALADVAPMVRIEALRAGHRRPVADACVDARAAATDIDTNVALTAIDQLAACGQSAEAVSYLLSAVADLVDAEAPRNWHRTAHALVALSSAAPDRASDALNRIAGSRQWELRMYAARAAAAARHQPTLDRLVRDINDNVVEAAVAGLATVAGHASDTVYIAALSREAFGTVRAAALALDRTPTPDAAVPALKAALQRVDDDGRPGAADARLALRSTLGNLGVAPRTPKPTAQPPATLDPAELRRLKAPRARFTIRDVGQFDLALFTMEAPATVLRFVRLAQAGFYNGLTFHRVVPNTVARGGSAAANDFSGDGPLTRDEVGLWPHVRGAFGIPTRGRDTGDARFFIDLVDNPRFDHTYTVFAQILNGLDIVDRMLEGDVIESVEILP